MAKKRTYPKKIIEDYLKNVNRHINVESGFLFGSFARGDARPWSDVDLIVVSSAFKEMDFMKRLKLLSHLREGAARTIAMDVIGYTPEEFENMDQGTPNTARMKQEGKIIYKAATSKHQRSSKRK